MARQPGFKERCILRCLVPMGPTLLRLWSRTFDLRVENEEPIQEHLRAGGRVLFACWHQRLIGGIVYLTRYTPAIMISRSFDGEVISRIVEDLGWTAVRGSSSRGGARGLDQMIDHARRGRVTAHIVDGPRGPAHKLKPGLMKIGQHGGVAFTGIYIAYDRARETRSWDRFQLPRPGARVLLRFGRLMPVPATASKEELDSLRADYEAEMIREYERADEDVRAETGW